VKVRNATPIIIDGI
jgi:hypothetical protein